MTIFENMSFTSNSAADFGGGLSINAADVHDCVWKCVIHQ